MSSNARKFIREMSHQQKYYITCSFILLFCISIFSSTYTISSIPNPKLRDANSFISNPDGILNQQTEKEINEKLLQLEKDFSVEVAVVLVNSIGDAEIKTFANELFNKWEIGKSDNDNGLLLLLVLDQRKVTFEIGYGLEGIIPDAISKRIQMKYMIPEFKEGNYNGAVLAGIEQIILTIHKDGEYAEENKEKISEEISVPSLIGLVVLTLALFLLPLWKLAEKRTKKDATQSKLNYYRQFNVEKKSVSIVTLFLIVLLLIFLGVFCSSFLNFSTLACYMLSIPLLWIIRVAYARYLSRKIKNIPLKCNVCSGDMHILADAEKIKDLNPQQQLENKLGSVYYDVYLCRNCENKRVLSYQNNNSPYKKCPNCGTHSFILKNKKTVLHPTYVSAGKEELTWGCEFCNYKNKTTHPISKRVRVAPVVGGPFSSRGGGFGGGSFGGGRSGGGGSTSGW